MRRKNGAAELIERLYASIGDSEEFRHSVASAGSLLRAEALAVEEYDFGLKKGRGIALMRLADGALRRPSEHYSSLDVWMRHGRHHVAPGRILLSHEMFREERLEETEWYSQFLRPENLFHSIGVVLGMGDSVATTATFLRRKDGGRFGAADVAALRHLAPHLRRAFALHRQFRAASLRADDTRHLLDRLPVAVIVVDGNMRIDSANRTGRDILAGGEGLTIRGDRLAAPPPHDPAGSGQGRPGRTPGEAGRS